MGKGGKGAKKNGGSKMRTQFPAMMSDDDLLDQAVQENKAAAALALQQAQAKTEVDMGNMGDECPSKQELLATLDRIMLFDLRSGEEGMGHKPCISGGEWVFYCDESDAIEAMEAHKQEHPGARVAVGCTPLGRAFALSEGKAFGFQNSMAYPMRIQGSKAVLEAIGEADAKQLCPQALAEQLNEKTSTIPMFSVEELHEKAMSPFFFTKIDMVDYWTAKTGKPESSTPLASHLASHLLLPFSCLHYILRSQSSSPSPSPSRLPCRVPQEDGHDRLARADHANDEHPKRLEEDQARPHHQLHRVAAGDGH